MSASTSNFLLSGAIDEGGWPHDFTKNRCSIDVLPVIELNTRLGLEACAARLSQRLPCFSVDGMP